MSFFNEFSRLVCRAAAAFAAVSLAGAACASGLTPPDAISGGLGTLGPVLQWLLGWLGG